MSIDNKLIMMVGLPRSGKSTTARTLGAPVVDTDSIRKAIGTFPFIPEAEPFVWLIAKYMVKALFYAGHTEVVLDATNLTVIERAKWKDNLYTIVYYPVTTSKSECIKRVVSTDQQYLIPVIERMAQKIEWPTKEEN